MLGSNIDQVLSEVNCDVMMLQTGDTASAQKILMPIAEPRQVGYSLQLIQQFSANEMQLDLLHVFSAETPSAERERMTRAAAPARRRQRRRQAGKLLTDQSADRIESIVQAAGDYDYVVIGETRDTRVKQRLFGNTSMVIADRTAHPSCCCIRRPAALSLACARR